MSNRFKTEDDSFLLLEEGPNLLLEAPDTDALSINPGRILPSATTAVAFIGTNTAWNSSTPTISAAGAPADDGDWSLGSLTVDDDTHAHRDVTAGATIGTVTWTDSTTAATTTMTVAKKHPGLVWIRRRYR